MVNEVGGELNLIGFEEGHCGGAAKEKKAFLLALVYGAVGGKGLVDTTDVGRAEFDDGDGPQMRRLKLGDHALVLPEIGELPSQGHGTDGVEVSLNR